MKITSAGRFAVAVAAAAIASQVVEAKNDKDKQKDNGASKFIAMAPCSTASNGGGLKWANGRHPFQGGSGAYGDIFFGGGATSVPAAAATEHASPVASNAGNGGSVPAASPGNSGGGGNAPASAPGAAVSAAAPTLPATAQATLPAAVAAAPAAPAPSIGAAAVPQAVGTTGAAAANAPASVALATPAAVTPEPASLLLMGVGLGAVVMGRRRARQSKR